MSEFVMVETALPRRPRLESTAKGLAYLVARANLVSIVFAPDWLRIKGYGSEARPWKRLWAVTPHERLRVRCLLDAVVTELYGFDFEDLAWILRGCDYPAKDMRDRGIVRLLDGKGFWRVDGERDPELRQTVLSLVAHRDLKRMIAAHGGDREQGIEAFCRQNGGDGWMLPEALRLSDFGLGHDERAKEAQPVRERLGERFLPWQLEQSVEVSWAECERHARNLLGAEGFARLQAEVRGESPAVQAAQLGRAAEVPAPYGPEAPGSQHLVFPRDPDLFGERLEDPPRRRKPRRGR